MIALAVMPKDCFAGLNRCCRCWLADVSFFDDFDYWSSMLNAATIIAAAVLVALLAYLPAELAECDRLVEEHGIHFICAPVTFLAIPVVAPIFLFAGVMQLRSR
ncbi:MAG: hypothetical protein AAF526_11570 [Pseudomonadota bacterium]